MAHTSTIQMSQMGLDSLHSHDPRAGDPCSSCLMSTGAASAEPRTQASPGSPGTGFHLCSEPGPGCGEDGEAASLQCAIPKCAQTSTHRAVRAVFCVLSLGACTQPLPCPGMWAGILRELPAATAEKARERVQAGHAGHTCIPGSAPVGPRGEAAHPHTHQQTPPAFQELLESSHFTSSSES